MMPDSMDPCSDAHERPSVLLMAVTLFGSYCLATNVAIALHELGHILGCWIGGGKPLGVVLGPQGVSGSYAARDLSFGFTRDYGYLAHLLGGFAFGILFGLLALALARLFQRGTAGWIACIMIGTMCVANNGGYLFFGGISPFDDVAGLIELGTPRWLLIVVGAMMLAAFLLLFARCLGGIGLRRDDPYWKWLATTELGVLFYLGFAVGLQMLWHPPVPVKIGAVLAATPIALLVLASIAYQLRRTIPNAPTVEPSWWKADLISAWGVLFVIAEMLFFSYDFDAGGAP